MTQTLSPAHEQTLWVRYKDDRDSDARDALVLAYMRTVKFIAGRMAMHVPQSVEMDDLIGWGTIGLLDAVEKFDHKQDIRFSTYASIRIRGAIIDQIRSLDWAPRSLRTMARKVAAARDKLRHQHGREPNAADIAALLDTTTEHVADTMAQLQAAQMLSLDDYLPAEDAAEVRKSELISDQVAPHPREAAESNERQALLVEAILSLPDQQQKVLNLYYYEQLTLKEIGMVLEVSESRICQIHTAATKRLRSILHGET